MRGVLMCISAAVKGSRLWAGLMAAIFRTTNAGPALDPEMINAVLDVMVALAKDGMTMMVVTHEMGFARKVAHRVVFMVEGSIIEEAPTADFFNQPRNDREQIFLSKILHH
jgi:ABC-type polar amino acid transport system ATPase subunit